MLRSSARRAFALARRGTSPLVGRIVPSGRQTQLRHAASRLRFEEHMRSQLGGFYAAVDPGPAQPGEVSLRTAAMEGADVDLLRGREAFFDLAYRQVQLFADALASNDVNLRTIGSVLEIGVGGARLLRHFRCIEGARLVGTDIDASSIAWCRDNVPGIEFLVNEREPPLPLEASSFDLAIASSVFTHIPLTAQEPWLREMHRVMRPGATFLCTVVGRWHIERQLTGDAAAALRSTGRFELRPGEAGLSLSSEETGQFDVFQTRSEVIRAFGEVFTLVDYLRGPQDLLVLRKT